MKKLCTCQYEMRDVCLVDSGTTHTILRDKKYFENLVLTKAKVNTISGPTDLIEGSGRAVIVLTNGTRLTIKDALHSSRSRRNLISFKDIRENGYHIKTTNENDKELLFITSNVSSQKLVLEKLNTYSSGLYYVNITLVETYAIMKRKFIDPKMLSLWHDRLGHPGSTMMHRIHDRP